MLFEIQTEKTISQQDIYIAYYDNCNSSQYLVVPNTTTALSITLVFFDSLLFSIVLRPTMLHCPLYLKTKLNPNLRFAGFSDKHMINLKQVSRCADCTLTGRQTEQNINHRRCSKNNARRVGLVTGSAVFVYETWISCKTITSEYLKNCKVPNAKVRNQQQKTAESQLQVKM